MKTNNIDNGHEYVDLGLSVKWATCNVGATKPEEYGNYYAWGELKQKKTYKKSNYKFAINMKGVVNEYSKYNEHDRKTTLEPIDDVATQTLGEQWRMPTDAECKELIKNCTLTWTDDYNGTGVAGRIVTSKINGNYIFLPAAGYRYGCLEGAGHSGSYWSSSIYDEYTCYVRCLFLFSDDMFFHHNKRYFGYSIRPVLSNY